MATAHVPGDAVRQVDGHLAPPPEWSHARWRGCELGLRASLVGVHEPGAGARVARPDVGRLAGAAAHAARVAVELEHLELRDLIAEVATDLWLHFGAGEKPVGAVFESESRSPDWDKYPGN